MRKFLLFAVFAALLSLPAAAGAASIPYPGNGKGRPAVSTSQAISEQEKLASAGNTDAQYKLGELLFQNYSVISAKKWLEKAAASGNLLAEARLFYMHNCFSKKIDPTKKFHKFNELSEQGTDAAMILLGDFYLAGCGVTKDRQLARLNKTHRPRPLEKPLKRLSSPRPMTCLLMTNRKICPRQL